MPANLPPDAKKKWFEVTLTRNPEERLRLMGEFLSLVPKHKGTDRLCAQVRRQMSQLRQEIEDRRRVAKRSTGLAYFVEKAGAAQVAIIGPTNAGRSSLLKAVTNASVDVASWPFTTRVPTPGMLPYQDIQFQLVEAPPIVEGSSEGRADGFQVLSLARNADGLIIVVDLTDDPGGNLLMVRGELENSRVLTAEPEGEVEVTRRGYGSDIQFVWEGALEGCTTEEVVGLLKEYKVRSALVRVRGRVTLDAVEDAMFGNAVYRPTLVVANKADIMDDERVIESVREAARPLEVLVVSAEKTPDLGEALGSRLFDLLGVVRVYTKQPGGEPSKEPIVARRGLTVGDLAKMIHSDFYERFRYARLWGPSAKFDSERVGLDRELSDGDVVQLHA
ncbi:MAG: TGS domain-containing protein [Candidatus Bathyarchaeota archaeon]|nr:TGS domain-containing protein [Candidatus Bathyarchaeota archaeon]MDH5792855.1 TGS domain-containing protein [Candidatus Bathyarchaeota archaeon]